MQVLVIRTMASRGLRIVGSGTFSTFIFSTPIQHTAFMTLSFLEHHLHYLGFDRFKVVHELRQVL
jgi:hypothetical protein